MISHLIAGFCFFMNKIKVDKNGVPITVSKEIGNTYGMLTILSYSRNKKQFNGTSYIYYVNCLCKCGIIKEFDLFRVKKGSVKSCGCYSSELKSIRFTKHGLSRSSFYNNYRAMINRCYNVNNKKYHLYGGIGIVVCERWRGKDGFINYVSDMSPKTEKTVDRIDSTKNYSCGKCEQCMQNGWDANCRWANTETQNRNTKRNKFVHVNGVKMTIAESSRLVGISESVIKYRIESGWTESDALSIPAYIGNDKRIIYGTSKYKNKHRIKR